jgi:hypothetical protein
MSTLAGDQSRRFVPAQLICLAGSLLTVLFVGEVLSICYWQMRFLAQDLLDGKPLPGITTFFMANRYLVAHLTMIPWICLIVLPLLGKRDYFDFPAFAARLAVFWTVELLLFLVVVTGLALPFLPYYGVLEAYSPSTFDTIGKVAIWLLGTLGVAGLVKRLWWVREKGR